MLYEVITRNLGAMIKQAQQAGAKVLLVGMQLPPNWGPEYTDAFARVFPALASTHETALLPFLFDGLQDGPQHFQPDRLHPNEAAQSIIADTVWAKLAPLLVITSYSIHYTKLYESKLWRTEADIATEVRAPVRIPVDSTLRGPAQSSGARNNFV